MHVEPYLFFEGRAAEAIEFYRKAVGAEVATLMRNKESPEPPPPGMLPPGSEDKVMHSTLRIGNTNVMLSDGRCSGRTNFQGFALSIDARDEAEAERWFNALQDGGHVRMPLGKTFFSPKFGMVEDRFGLLWMVIVAQ